MLTRSKTPSKQCLIISVLCLLCFFIFLRFSSIRDFNVSTQTGSLVSQSQKTDFNQVAISSKAELTQTSLRPTPKKTIPCSDLYQEFRDIDFMTSSVKETICSKHPAYSTDPNGLYYPCIFSDKFKLDSDMKFTPAKLKHSTKGVEMPFYTYSAQDLYISAGILATKTWEPAVVNTIMTITSKTPQVTFLDIGSNIGVYAINAAYLGVPVVAVDANIRNIVRMRRSLADNKVLKQTQIVWSFLGAKPKLVYLSFQATCNVGGAHKNERADAKSDIIDTVPVSTLQADQIADLVSTPNAVLKLDIQGGEPEFFATAVKLFSQLNIVAVQMEWELHARMITAEQGKVMIDFMLTRNYTALNIGSLLPMSMQNWKSWPDMNLVWIKNQYLKNGAYIFG